MKKVLSTNQVWSNQLCSKADCKWLYVNVRGQIIVSIIVIVPVSIIANTDHVNIKQASVMKCVTEYDLQTKANCDKNKYGFQGQLIC